MKSLVAKNGVLLMLSEMTIYEGRAIKILTVDGGKSSLESSHLMSGRDLIISGFLFVGNGFFDYMF